MANYEVSVARRWENKATGRTASVHGAVPYTSEAEKANWAVATVGYTIFDRRSNTYGIGCAPFATAAEAQAWIDAKEAQEAEYRALYCKK
jgi:hypothetical protein